MLVFKYGCCFHSRCSAHGFRYFISFADISSGYESDVENLSGSPGQDQGTPVSRPRRRRDRTQFTPHDLYRLEATFLLDRYPGVQLRMRLALELGVTEDRIQVNNALCTPV